MVDNNPVVSKETKELIFTRLAEGYPFIIFPAFTDPRVIARFKAETKIGNRIVVIPNRDFETLMFPSWHRDFEVVGPVPVPPPGLLPPWESSAVMLIVNRDDDKLEPEAL